MFVQTILFDWSKFPFREIVDIHPDPKTAAIEIALWIAQPFNQRQRDRYLRILWDWERYNEKLNVRGAPLMVPSPGGTRESRLYNVLNTFNARLLNHMRAAVFLDNLIIHASGRGGRSLQENLRHFGLGEITNAGSRSDYLQRHWRNAIPSVHLALAAIRNLVPLLVRDGIGGGELLSQTVYRTDWTHGVVEAAERIAHEAASAGIIRGQQEAEPHKLIRFEGGPPARPVG